MVYGLIEHSRHSANKRKTSTCDELMWVVMGDASVGGSTVTQNNSANTNLSLNSYVDTSFWDMVDVAFVCLNCAKALGKATFLDLLHHDDYPQHQSILINAGLQRVSPYIYI